MTDSELIFQYGGPATLARRLGYPERGGVQRIQNWLKRGIPPAVKIQHPELFLKAPAKSFAATPETASPIATAAPARRDAP